MRACLFVGMLLFCVISLGGCMMGGSDFDDNPVGVPSNLIASSFTDRVELNWDSLSRVEGYYVYRSIDASADSFTNANGYYASLPSYQNYYVDHGLSAGAVYYYAVRAFKDGKFGLPSSIVSGQLSAATSLSAPMVTYLFMSMSMAELRWTEVVGATSYRVYFSTNGDIESEYACVATNYGATATNYMRSDAFMSGLYHFKVKAFDATRESPYSTVKQFTLP